MRAADCVSEQVSECEERDERLPLLQRGVSPFAEPQPQLVPYEREPARYAPESSLPQGIAEWIVQPPNDSQDADSQGADSQATDLHLAVLSRFMKHDSSFLEVGASDCSLSLSVADRVRHVYAVARSPVITETRRLPANFHLILAEGARIPVPQSSIGVAYSNGLVEYLSLKETAEQLANIYRALARGGVYVCFARNRLLRAQDLSVAHAENRVGPAYTFSELHAVLRKVGFRGITQYARCAGATVRLSGALARVIESGVRTMPSAHRERACGSHVLRKMLEIRLVARK